MATTQSMPKVWAGQVRAPFLLLSVLLTTIGAALALHDNTFHALRFVLATVGVVLAHVAVNLFNELSDHKSGIDDHTKRTPFSGGSGTLQAGLLSRSSVTAVACGVSLVALAIGVYLSWAAGWFLMAFVVAGGLASVFYTSHFARWGLGELIAGLTLGSLVVLGTYYAQSGTLTSTVVLFSIPPGILTALLLLLNEFPDVEADKTGGRRHMVILMGYKGAAVVYTALLFGNYIFIAVGAFVWFPKMVLLGLLTLPLAIKAATTALKRGHEHEAMLPALGANVILVLATDLLLAVGYLIDHAIT